MFIIVIGVQRNGKEIKNKSENRKKHFANLAKYFLI